MSRIAVLTDLHITVAPDPARPDADARLRAAIHHLNTDPHGAERVIITGDLTDKGDRPSFDRLRDHLTALRLPYALMLGNHDHREPFLAAFPDAPVTASGHVQQIVDLPDARLILLDTLNGPPYVYPYSHTGMLCAARLAWLDAALDTSRRCILFMHHPAHDTGFAAMDSIKLLNGSAFYDRIEGRVGHIVCGHVHRTISGSHRGIPFSIFKSNVGQMPMMFETMDFHMETPEPPAYGLLMITPDSVVAHTEDYGLTDLTGAGTAP